MATSRYFALFLEQKGKLEPVFRALRDRGFNDLKGDARDHSVRLLEDVTNQTVDELDSEFADWFQSGRAENITDLRNLDTAGGTVYAANANVNIRTGPDTYYSIKTVLRRGNRVAVFGESEGWFQVRFSDGTTGFIFGRYLDTVVEKGLPK